ncbi:26S proteasome regulatory subunit 7 [Phlyctochytrium planicorne]|nr:26S proteasome regulatory subunit 7 [Phlyctochytrium planicorne]
MSEDDYESIAGSSVYVNLMAGALAGITEHTVMYPFDSIKTRMQVIAPQPQALYSSVINALTKISSTEGFNTLWRGVNSVIVGAGPAHALYFATYEHCKNLFGANDEGHHLLESAAAGACATIASDGLMNPFDVVKQRMQLHGSKSTGVIQCAKTILQTEGWKAFYVSYPTTLSMTIPFQSIHFATYEYFRKVLNPSGAYDPSTHVVAGGLAGAIAAAATTPLDVAKTLLQTRGTSTNALVRSASGLSDAMRIIYQTQGISGFFKGIQPRVLTHMPSTAICWTTRTDMPPKADWEKYSKPIDDDKEQEKIKVLDEGDIALLKTYGQGPYAKELKKIETDIRDAQKRVNEKMGVKESDTGLAPPNLWDLPADKQRMGEEHPLQVARCTKIIQASDGEDAKYLINIKQLAKYVVGLGERVAPTDIEEGMRVGVDRNKFQIQIPLPPKIDPSVTMMQVEEKPDVTYSDIGGCKEQIEKLREVVEMPLLQPERFVNLGIDPPKGVLLYGPPGTGKTLCARAVANRTDATFIRVIGSELVQKYVGEGARMVRELFEMARTKKACIIFFDEVDAIGGARFDDGAGGDNEVQRTMLELINQLDGFDPRGNIKVLMATNRPDTLDPALMRPGRLDRKVEFGLPDLEGRAHIFKIHARSMSVERDIRYELLARLCPNATGAELRSVCTEAGMFAIRSRRKVATEKDFLEAVNKVIKAYAKFSSTPRYLLAM